MLALAALTGCGSSSGGSDADAAAATPTAAPSVAAPLASASGAEDAYSAALAQRACYADSFDAAKDPLKKAIGCDTAKAAFRLVGIQAASAGDCPPNQVLVSAEQATADAVAPSLCLEPVTH